MSGKRRQDVFEIPDPRSTVRMGCSPNSLEYVDAQNLRQRPSIQLLSTIEVAQDDPAKVQISTFGAPVLGQCLVSQLRSGAEVPNENRPCMYGRQWWARDSVGRGGGCASRVDTLDEVRDDRGGSWRTHGAW